MTRRPVARAGIGPVIALVLLALIPAALLAYGWRWAAAREPKPVVDAAATDTSVPAALTTPLLSFRRAPQTLSSSKSEEALVAAVAAVGVNSVNAQSCLVVSLDGRTIFDQGGDVPITPASNQKIQTAVAALQVLGPDSVFTTNLKGTVVDGVVQGDLYFVGGGDPLLSTAGFPETETYPSFNVTSLEQLADNLAAAGVTSIAGNVVADESRYDVERFVPGWDNTIRNTEAGPLSALMVNDAARNANGARYNDPAVGAAQELIKLLRARNITGGNATAGTAPADAPVITSVTSAPLSAIVQEMLTTSDDNTAELLMKEMGYATTGVGSTANGAAAVVSALGQLGIDTSKLNVVDGSGLDATNVSRCGILLTLLGMQPLDGPIGTGLPIAAQTGTLAGEFAGSPMAGRLHAKTGSLANAKALTGYVPSPAGTLGFSMVLNGENVDEEANYRPVWDQLAQALAIYPSGPAVDQLQPR